MHLHSSACYGELPCYVSLMRCCNICCPRALTRLRDRTVLRPLVDPVTKSKIVMCTSKELDSVLAQLHFGPELRTWLVTEAAENRNKKLCGEKVYRSDAIVAEASKTKDSEHSIYGTPALLARIHAHPELVKLSDVVM